MTRAKVYLGDAVYVEPDEPTGGLVLTTSNGIQDTNIIILEPEILLILLQYIRKRMPKFYEKIP